jgi:hypothetical protein
VEEGEVGGGGGAGDEVGAVLAHPADLRVEVVGRFRVGAEVDEGMPAWGRHGGEAIPLVPQQSALQVLVPQAPDGASPVYALPQVGEHGGDVVQSPREVVRPPETVAGPGAACVDVRLPGEGGRHTGDPGLFAGVGDGGQYPGSGHGEDDVCPVDIGQVAHGLPGRLRIRTAVAHGDGHVVAAATVADVREPGCEPAQSVRQR